MKAEFLQNFKVGDTPLPKEVVDAILAENDCDVKAAVKPFSDYESIKEQLIAAKEGLKAFDGVDVRDLQTVLPSPHRRHPRRSSCGPT